jgi:hypothetical protein|tara:strand:- start:325 stop:588 length:264 start_codon:yes stop_codon:yes gene_type:complete
VGLISEKQLREVRVKLFYIMDDVIINSEKCTPLSKENIMELSLKVVGLSYNDILTQQLWAEYKTWQQTKDNTIKELRSHEKDSRTNI